MSDSTSQLAAGLAKLALALKQHAWAMGEQSGLSPTQSQVLAVLASRDAVGLAVSHLATELAVTQATVSDAISALQRKGLVTKTRSEADARVVLVQLTEAGTGQAGATAQWPDAMLSALSGLDAAERAVLTRVIIKTIRTMQVAGQIPVARMCVTCNYFRPHAHTDADRPHHCALVNAPLGDGDLRLDCPEQVPAEASVQPRLWQLFIEGRPPAAPASTF
jgi:DNA-binding MarR family transcriptional regulator